MIWRWPQTPHGFRLFLGFILFILVTSYTIFFWDYYLEDAYMHLRYAENSVTAGLWSVWNLGEKPISGSSSPLWLFLLIVNKMVGISPYVASKVFAAASFWGLLWIMLNQVSLKDLSRFDLFCFTLFSATLFPLVFYTQTGMEAIPYVFLLWLSFASKKPLITTLASCLVVLIRPEGVLMTLGIIAAKNTPHWKKAMLLAVFPLLVCGICLSFHAWYFGYPFPNTYYAKADMPLFESAIYGLRTFYFFINDYYVFLVFTALYFFKNKPAEMDRIFIGLSILIALFIFKLGGDNRIAFPLHRHLLPLIPFLCIYVFQAIHQITRDFFFRKIAFSLMLSLCFFSQFSMDDQILMNAKKSWNSTLKRWTGIPNVTENQTDLIISHPTVDEILEKLPPGSSVAHGAMGELPYRYLNLSFIDMLGLHDEHIAHFGKRQYGQVDTKYDTEYVLARNPDIIVLSNSNKIIQLNHVNHGIFHWRSLVNEMLNHPEFRKHYTFYPSYPSDGGAVFVRSEISLRF